MGGFDRVMLSQSMPRNHGCAVISVYPLAPNRLRPSLLRSFRIRSLDNSVKTVSSKSGSISWDGNEGEYENEGEYG